MSTQSLSIPVNGTSTKIFSVLGQTIRSTLLLTFMLFLLRFMGLILHEGGHALYVLVQGVNSTLYVHPFAFAGYSRPMIDFSVWTHISGSAVALPAALLISLLFWKRRSFATLPFLMLFPWVALNDGMYILQRQGDYRNLMQITQLPDFVFMGVGGLIACVGLVLLFSLLPMLGLSAQDKKTFLVIPAAMFLWAFISMLVAHGVVPGSWIAVRYSLAREIIYGTNFYYENAIVGLQLALLYLTFYRWLRPRLGTGLQMETVHLTWSDLRIPGLLFAISVILGLFVIT